MRLLTIAASLILLSGTGLPLVAADQLSLAASGPRPNIAVDPLDGIFAHVMDGATWKTTFIFTNLQSTQAQFLIGFYADNGDPLVLPIVGVGNSSTVYGSIPAKGTVTFETDGTSDQLKVGSAFFFCLDRPATQSGAQALSTTVGGMAIFRQRIPGKPDSEAVVPMSSFKDSDLTFPFDNTSDFSTGVALSIGNTGSSPITVTIRDEGGSIIGQDAFTLGPMNHTAFAVAVKYPQTAGKRGSLQVSTTQGSLGGLGLRFNPNGSFTSMHPVSLPPSVPTQPSGSVPSGGTAPACVALEGTQIFAYDGRFLGKITTNKYAIDAIGNKYGTYGSSYSSTSIYNTYGTYGSPYSQLSAFNPLAAAPPVIYIGSTPAAYLTVNTLKTPRIDPNSLFVCSFR